MTFQFNDPAQLKAVSVSKVTPARRRRPMAFYPDFGKRVLDIAIVVLTAPITVPLVALMALLIALEGVSPLYVQKRIGRNGRVFKMVKFRTMVRNADAKLDNYLQENPAAQREWDRTQKLKDDPRVTRVGKLMRKCSMDELPQFWNVLTGDMSLVGPRPMMVDQANLYPGQSYYWMRPGVSGLWQVNERNNSAFTDRAAYDDKYFNNMSFKTDCAIIAKTFVVVFRATGY